MEKGVQLVQDIQAILFSGRIGRENEHFWQSHVTMVFGQNGPVKMSSVIMNS